MNCVHVLRCGICGSIKYMYMYIHVGELGWMNGSITPCNRCLWSSLVKRIIRGNTPWTCVCMPTTHLAIHVHPQSSFLLKWCLGAGRYILLMLWWPPIHQRCTSSVSRRWSRACLRRADWAPAQMLGTSETEHSGGREGRRKCMITNMFANLHSDWEHGSWRTSLVSKDKVISWDSKWVGPYSTLANLGRVSLSYKKWVIRKECQWGSSEGVYAN